MRTQTPPFWQGRAETALPTSTTSSEHDLVLFSQPAANPAYTLIFGVVATTSPQELRQAAKYVYAQRLAVPGARYEIPWFSSAEEDVGFPGATVVSLADWPDMWQHPERLRAARDIARLVAHFGEEESRSWHAFVDSFNLFLRLHNAPSATFGGLAAKWKAEVRYLSDTNEICTHPAYQQIIGLGVFALPFIFAELEREPNNWFWALKAITGDDPVPEEHMGMVDLMAQDWLNWAQKHKQKFAADWERVFVRIAS